jgi:hypothetical protein
MASLTRALWVEILKLKRTLALWLAIILPLGVVAIQFLAVVQRADYYAAQRLVRPWLEFGRQTIFFWTLLALPLFVTLETALLGGLEHSGDHWKQLFARPVSRGAIYAAKLAAGMALVAVSLSALLVQTIVAGWVLSVVLPELGFKGPIPWKEFLTEIGIAYLGCWLIIAIHTWVALRWKSFVVASAAGILLTVAGMIVINAEWGSYYPWALSAMALNSLEENSSFASELAFSGLGAVAIALLGGLEFTRRDVL